jgi:hypothetical protein
VAVTQQPFNAADRHTDTDTADETREESDNDIYIVYGSIKVIAAAIAIEPYSNSNLVQLLLNFSVVLFLSLSPHTPENVTASCEKCVRVVGLFY